MILAELTVEEASALISGASYEEVHGCEHCDHVCSRVRRIHTFLGMMGADWDLEEALDFVRRSERRWWARTLVGHDLGVRVPGEHRAVYFNVPLPADPPRPVAPTAAEV